MPGPEDNPADDVQPTKEEWEAYEQERCASANGDQTIWREVAGDYYSPSIHVTPGGGIGINVGGMVHVRTLAEWHALACEGMIPNRRRILEPQERNSMTKEEADTERFYLVREQRNKLLWACEKALAAYDAAHATGKSNWGGEDIDKMRAAVEECKIAVYPTAEETTEAVAIPQAPFTAWWEQVVEPEEIKFALKGELLNSRSVALAAWHARDAELAALRTERDQAVAWNDVVFREATETVRRAGGVGEGGHTVDRLVFLDRTIRELRETVPTKPITLQAAVEKARGGPPPIPFQGFA